MSTAFDPTPDVPEDQDGDTRPDTRSHTVNETVTSTSSDAGDARRPSIPHLVIGLVFVGVAALWALAAFGAVGSEDTWLLPGLLVVAGATGLVAALAGSTRGKR